MKEVLNQKDYEKALPIMEYLETNSAITTQIAKQITGKSLATAWRYLQILVKADVLEADGNTNNAEYCEGHIQIEGSFMKKYVGKNEICI